MKSVWRWLLILLCLTLILGNASQVISKLSVSGWDFKIYSAAAKVFAEGGNPYLVSSLQKYDNSALSFVYLPLTLPIFQLINLLSWQYTYVIIWAALLLLAILIILATDKIDPLLLITLLTTGFLAVFWNFLTGNVGIVELAFLAGVYYYLARDKFKKSSVLLGIVSALKILPLAYSLSYASVDATWKKRAVIIGTALAAFIAVNLISAILFPALTASYFQSITGGYADQHSPIRETGGKDNPSIYFLIQDVLSHFQANSEIAIIILYILLAIATIAGYLYFARNNKTLLYTFSMGIIAFTIILPRLKPYSFTYALIPAYFLMKDMSDRNKIIVLLIVSVLPAIGFFGNSDTIRNLLLKTNEALFNLIYSGLPYILIDYSQTISLILFFIYCIGHKFLDRHKIAGQ